MLSTDQARKLALTLPETVEQDHHGRPSFRVCGRIFATLWTDRGMNVMAGAERIHAAAEDRPDVCREFFWGKRLAAAQVDLERADAELLEDLLDHAWRAKAPARLLRATVREIASTPRPDIPVCSANTETAPDAEERRDPNSARYSQLLRGFGLGSDDLAVWEASGLPAAAFEDWLTDHVARRPSGTRAREVYGAENVHDFARRAVLQALGLGPADRLLEVGCGGGLLLRDARSFGTAATGLDHSAEMVGLARQRAPGAEVVLASAERLPFPDGAFTAVAMSIVFMFLPDPGAVLRECHRVLTPGGRVAVYTASPELRGTPAAPEPLASRCYFYEDDALAGIARRADFTDVVVANDDGGQLLTAHRAVPNAAVGR